MQSAFVDCIPMWKCKNSWKNKEREWHRFSEGNNSIILMNLSRKAVHKVLLHKVLILVGICAFLHGYTLYLTDSFTMCRTNAHQFLSVKKEQMSKRNYERNISEEEFNNSFHPTPWGVHTIAVWRISCHSFAIPCSMS